MRTGALLDDLNAQLEERRARMQELRQYMDGQVTELQLMKESIALLLQSNASAEERLEALQTLQSLVEPIDNANGQSCLD